MLKIGNNGLCHGKNLLKFSIDVTFYHRENNRREESKYLGGENRQ